MGNIEYDTTGLPGAIAAIISNEGSVGENTGEKIELS